MPTRLIAVEPILRTRYSRNEVLQ